LGWIRHLCLLLDTDFPISGLFLTYLGLYLMDGHGQPALLYLVPCTLGNWMTAFSFWTEVSWFFLFKITFLCAHRKALLLFTLVSGLCILLGLVRGELKDLWNYSSEDASSRASSGLAWSQMQGKLHFKHLNCAIK
jgi:signal peptide peptidase-like protein 2B